MSRDENEYMVRSHHGWVELNVKEGSPMARVAELRLSLIETEDLIILLQEALKQANWYYPAPVEGDIP